jgi:hypothetical protein
MVCVFVSSSLGDCVTPMCISRKEIEVAAGPGREALLEEQRQLEDQLEAKKADVDM